MQGGRSFAPPSLQIPTQILLRARQILLPVHVQQLFLNANMAAHALGMPLSSGYELMRKPGFPVLKAGSRIVVPKGVFIRWAERNTAGGTVRGFDRGHGVQRV